MLTQETIDQAKTKIDEATSIVIALPSDPDEDVLAAGLGLFLTLKQQEKMVNIGCSSTPKVNSANLFGLNELTDNIGNKNLVITLDYPEEQLEKVDYNATDEGKKIELHVVPRTGASPPTGEQIHINFAGAKSDLIITLGIGNLEELGKLYADEKNFFDSTPIVSIGLKPQPNSFAQANLHSPHSASICELTAYFLKQVGFTPGNDPASNLLKLMVKSSDRFASPKTSPESLETAAFLMRQITPPPPPPQNQQVYNPPPAAQQ